MQLTRYEYAVCIEAETQEQADKVIEARVDHDEDLSADGVGDYSIYTGTGKYGFGTEGRRYQD